MTTATATITTQTFAETAAIDLAAAYAAQAGADARLTHTAPTNTSLTILRTRYADAVAARKLDRTPGPCTVLASAEAKRRRRQAKYTVTQYTTYLGSDNGPCQEGISLMPMTLGEVVELLGCDWTEEDGRFTGPIEQEWSDETGRLECEYRRSVSVSRLDGAEMSEGRLAKIKELAWMDV